jgi:hypothetical protein
MTERHSKQPPRALAAWASFGAFLAAAYWGTVLVLIRAMPFLGFDNRPISSWREWVVLLTVPLLLILVATYVAGIFWLILARFVFSWREASMVVCYGPTTSFDRWLLKTIVPGGPLGSQPEAAAMPSNNRWRGP